IGLSAWEPGGRVQSSPMSSLPSPKSFSLQGVRGARLKLAGGVALVALFLVALLAGGVVVWFRSAARAAIPQLDGTLVVAGLRAPVTVVRDGHGVPSITAGSLDDLFFVQGH